MTTTDAEWLRAFDCELRDLFAIDHNDAGVDECLLSLYADLPPRDAALAFGNDYDLARTPLLWPMPGLAMHS